MPAGAPDHTRRGRYLLESVVDTLKTDARLSELLPANGDEIAPDEPPRERAGRVSISASIAGDAGGRDGRAERSTYLVQIAIEWSERHDGSVGTYWDYDVADAIDAALSGASYKGLSGPEKGGGVSPDFDEDRGRYYMDKTYRYTGVYLPDPTA